MAGQKHPVIGILGYGLNNNRVLFFVSFVRASSEDAKLNGIFLISTLSKCLSTKGTASKLLIASIILVIKSDFAKA